MSSTAKVLYDYSSQAPNQISLKRGQIISIISIGAKGGWSKGNECETGKQGYFPSDYVEILPEAPTTAQVIPPQPAVTEKLKAKAMFDFAGSGKNEMPLKVGQIVEVVQRGKPGAWTKGSHGAFPTDYVQFIEPTVTTGNVNAGMSASNAGEDLLGMGSSSTVSNAQASDPFSGISDSSTSNTASDISAIFKGLDGGQNKVDPFATNSSSSATISGTSSGFGASGAAIKTNPSGPFKDDPFAGIESSSSSTAMMPQQQNNNISNAVSSNGAPAKPARLVSSMGGAAKSGAGTMGNMDPFSGVDATQSQLPKPAVSAAPAPATAPTIYARANFSRKGVSATELSIEAGETLIVLKQEGEWWYGSSLNSGKAGFFPGNYVEIRADLDPGKKPLPPVLSSAPGTVPTDVRHVAKEQIATGNAQVDSKKTPFGMKRSLPKAPSTMTAAALKGDKFAIQPREKDKQPQPIWYQPFFLDLFAGGYKQRLVENDPYQKVPAITRLHDSFHVARTMLERAMGDGDHCHTSEMHSVCSHCLSLLNDACDLTAQIPVYSNDPVKFFSFLTFLTIRIKAMRENDSIICPTSYVTQDGTDHGVILIVTKTRYNTDSNYSIAVVNTSQSNGVAYHASAVDSEDGSILRNLAFELNNIPNEKIQNSTFWFMVFKAAVTPNPKHNMEFFYDRTLTYLTSMPILSALQIGTALQIGINDFRPVPQGEDFSGINCVMECLRYIGRNAGLSPSEADHLPMTLGNICLQFIGNDLQVVSKLNPIEVDIIRIATRCAASTIASRARREPTTTPEMCQQTLDRVEQAVKRLNDLDDRHTGVPTFAVTTDTKLKAVCDYHYFGKFRLDFDVEKLAGGAPTPPIMRPIELTLVKDTVRTFSDVCINLRHTLDLCVLLSNQKAIVRNSYTLRIALISHVFTRVIPLPLPINHPDRKKRCFWAAQDIRYEMQAEILRLINMISRHFACAALSVNITRAGDAIRMLTFACLACVTDAAIRKIALDTPSQVSLHYSGKALGPVKPFGFEMGNFAEESEFLKFTTPEMACGRAQVLDYFHNMKKVVRQDHMMFRFDLSNDCTDGDKVFIDQVCLQMGFVRGMEKEYLSGYNRNMLDHYPEIGYFRDIVFMFKLVMVPTNDKLPELRPWSPEECALQWSVGKDPEANNYRVYGFKRELDCIQITEKSVEERQLEAAIPQRGIFHKLSRLLGAKKAISRANPSASNPSVLLNERVDTEDDILHIRKLPDFDGTMGPKDCELMCQYLTAPYMRIPLLLNFFSSENRLKSLRNKDLQDVLDAAIFEPGHWQEELIKKCPETVPADQRDYLSTPVGLLVNEIRTAPHILLKSVCHMLDRILEMDTGKYSNISEAILYCVRLAIRIEGYLVYITKNVDFHFDQNKDENQLNGAYHEASVRGLDCSRQVLNDTKEAQKELRNILDDRVFKMLARWIRYAKKDGKMLQACMLHANLAFLYRNVDADDLNPRIIFTSLASQIFIFNNYKYDLDSWSSFSKRIHRGIPSRSSPN